MSENEFLTARFTQFNDSLLLRKRMSITRAQPSWWHSFEKALVVAGADIAGAGAGISATKELAGLIGAATGGTGAAVTLAVGATICAASGSILAYEGMKSRTPKLVNRLRASDFFNSYSAIQNSTISYIRLKNIPKEFYYINVMGGMHNAIIENMKGSSWVGKNIFSSVHTRSNSDFLDVLNPDLVDKKPIKNIPDFTSKDFEVSYKALVNSGKLNLICDKIMKQTMEIFNKESFDYSLFFDKTEMPLTAKEEMIYDLYQNIIGEYPENINDCVFVANEYAQMISTMDCLTSNEKEKLFLTLAISVNSTYFWENNMENE